MVAARLVKYLKEVTVEFNPISKLDRRTDLSISFKNPSGVREGFHIEITSLGEFEFINNLSKMLFNLQRVAEQNNESLQIVLHLFSLPKLRELNNSFNKIEYDDIRRNSSLKVQANFGRIDIIKSNFEINQVVFYGDQKNKNSPVKVLMRKKLARIIRNKKKQLSKIINSIIIVDISRFGILRPFFMIHDSSDPSFLKGVIFPNYSRRFPNFIGFSLIDLDRDKDFFDDFNYVFTLANPHSDEQIMNKTPTELLDEIVRILQGAYPCSPDYNFRNKLHQIFSRLRMNQETCQEEIIKERTIGFYLVFPKNTSTDKNQVADKIKDAITSY